MNIIIFLILFFSLCFCCSGLYVKECLPFRRSSNVRIFACWIFLIFFCFFYVTRQIKIGSDTNVYVSVFKQVGYKMHSLTDNRVALNMERGFILVNYLLSLICKNERFFLLSISLFIYATFIKFICTNSKNTSFISFLYSICLFVTYGTYFFFFFTMRQHIAICIILIAITYAVKNNFFLYYVFVVIAFFFHTSSIVCIVIPFLNFFKINKRIITLYFLLLAILSMFGTKLLAVSLHFILPRYEHFLTNSVYGLQSSSKLGPALNLLRDVLLFALFYKNFHSFGKEKVFFFKIFMIALLFEAVSLKFSQIGRVAGYFSPFAFPLFAKSKRTLFFYFCFFTLLGHCIVINLFRNEWTLFFPFYLM